MANGDVRVWGATNVRDFPAWLFSNRVVVSDHVGYEAKLIHKLEGHTALSLGRKNTRVMGKIVNNHG